jgi:hypothetical protein
MSAHRVVELIRAACHTPLLVVGETKVANVTERTNQYKGKTGKVPEEWSR